MLQVMEDTNKTSPLMWSPLPSEEQPRPAIIARRLRNAASMQVNMVKFNLLCS